MTSIFKNIIKCFVMLFVVIMCFSFSLSYASNTNYLNRNSDSGYVWVSKVYKRDSIKTITFLDNNIVPENAITSWDVSDNCDGRITAWILQNEEDNNYYDLFIGSYEEIYAPIDSYSLFEEYKECTYINNFNLINTKDVTNMGHFFYNCYNLKEIDLSNINTENVTRMESMFFGCHTLTSIDLSKFDTYRVTNMYQMFWACYNLLSIDLSNLNTCNVERMDGMFCGCYNLANIIGLKNEKIDEEYIFAIKTSKVTEFGGMFRYCTSLKCLDLSSLNFSNAESLSSMFSDCTALEKVILPYNIKSNVKISNMFLNCSSLTYIDISNISSWDTSYSESVFKNCSSLKLLNIGYNTYFGDSSFSGLRNLERIIYKGDADKVNQFSSLKKYFGYTYGNAVMYVKNEEVKQACIRNLSANSVSVVSSFYEPEVTFYNLEQDVNNEIVEVRYSIFPFVFDGEVSFNYIGKNGTIYDTVPQEIGKYSVRVNISGDSFWGDKTISDNLYIRDYCEIQLSSTEVNLIVGEQATIAYECLNNNIYVSSGYYINSEVSDDKIIIKGIKSGTEIIKVQALKSDLYFESEPVSFIVTVDRRESSIVKPINEDITICVGEEKELRYSSPTDAFETPNVLNSDDSIANVSFNRNKFVINIIGLNEGNTQSTIYLSSNSYHNKSNEVVLNITVIKKTPVLFADTSSLNLYAGSKERFDFNYSGDGEISIEFLDNDIASGNLLDGDTVEVEGLISGDTTLILKASSTNQFNSAECEVKVHVLTPITYNVDFESNGGTEIDSQQINENNKLIEPSNPEKAGASFDGWYMDEDFQNKWDFDDIVTKDMVLYAKFIIIEPQFEISLPTFEDMEHGYSEIEKKPLKIELLNNAVVKGDTLKVTNSNISDFAVNYYFPPQNITGPATWNDAEMFIGIVPKNNLDVGTHTTTISIMVKGIDDIEYFLGSGDISFTVFEHTHEWSEWSIVKEASMFESGTKERVCSSCGEKEEDEIPKLENTLTKGDLDGSNSISIVDIRMLIGAYVYYNSYSNLSREDLYIMDMNNNSSVDIEDIRLLIQKYIHNNG